MPVITPDEALRQLAIDADEIDEADLTSIIQTAQDQIETKLNRTIEYGLQTQRIIENTTSLTLNTRTPIIVKDYLDDTDGILGGLDSFTITADNIAEAIDASDYYLLTRPHTRTRLYLTTERTISTDTPPIAIKLRYYAGWQPENVPEPIKTAIKFAIGQIYDYKQGITGHKTNKAPINIDLLIQKYKILT